MKRFLSILVLGTFLLACEKGKLTSKEAVSVVDIPPSEAAELIRAGEVLVLDVRTTEEYREGHITPSLLIPHQEVGERKKEILAYGDRPILVYCRSGHRSAIAAEELIKKGFKKVCNLAGGKKAFLSYIEGHPEYKDLWCTKKCPGICGYGRRKGGCGCGGTADR
ncbi:MAG: rhodanese-like domain-containing protein [Candidatus Latescibacterota bacterium]|nr:MAG: rhodanese-like domain-containing protein [Candidatus Latescibacterota bacterium]